MATQIQQQQLTASSVLCALCSASMQPNPSGMCVNCIRSQVDITSGIPKAQSVQCCRGCDRYLQPPRTWVSCAWESRELLTVCIKRLRGLSKVKLVDAAFVWTEPHSKRIKTKLTVQKEVFAGTILQQAFVVEYVIENFTCENCHRVAAKDTWQAVVQLRQKVDHRRTFFFLEQLILKHNAHEQAINIQEVRDGIDFYFSHRQHAVKLVDFISGVAPIKTKTSERLISADEHTGKAKMKWTFSTEISPICKEDLVCLPQRLSSNLGGIGPVVLCARATSGLTLVDSNTLMSTEMDARTYFKMGFPAIQTHKQLTEYTILDVELLGPRHGKYALAEVQCARTSDFGKNDEIYHCRSHLGNVIKAGDIAWGFDLLHANFNDSELEGVRPERIPDVVLVRKGYRVSKRASKRRWKLRHLNMEVAEDNTPGVEAERKAQDFEVFMQELEEDTDLRSQMRLYKGAPRDPTATHSALDRCDVSVRRYKQARSGCRGRRRPRGSGTAAGALGGDVRGSHDRGECCAATGWHKRRPARRGGHGSLITGWHGDAWKEGCEDSSKSCVGHSAVAGVPPIGPQRARWATSSKPSTPSGRAPPAACSLRSENTMRRASR